MLSPVPWVWFCVVVFWPVLSVCVLQCAVPTLGDGQAVPLFLWQVVSTVSKASGPGGLGQRPLRTISGAGDRYGLGWLELGPHVAEGGPSGV